MDSEQIDLLKDITRRYTDGIIYEIEQLNLNEEESISYMMTCFSISIASIILSIENKTNNNSDKIFYLFCSMLKKTINEMRITCK